jgi:hypothetical protein
VSSEESDSEVSKAVKKTNAPKAMAKAKVKVAKVARKQEESDDESGKQKRSTSADGEVLFLCTLYETLYAFAH